MTPAVFESMPQFAGDIGCQKPMQMGAASNRVDTSIEPFSSKTGVSFHGDKFLGRHFGF
jgi:hypothetical protein